MIWRLILDGTAAGAWNMAVDEALLLSHAAGATPPTVRFYNWQPACVSLGRFQKFDASRAATIRDCGFDLVRRPTGGRAVLHQHEITYCIVVNAGLLPANFRSVIGSYRFLSQGFASGLSELGIEAALAKPLSNPSGGNANCFASAAQCDFLVGDRKLIGAAQCRKNGVILQHGSLLLEVDEAAWKTSLGGSLDHLVSLRTLGVTASRTTIIESLCRGLERALQVALELAVLQADELDVARRLHGGRYATTGGTEPG